MFDAIIQSIYANLPTMTVLIIIYWGLSFIWLVAKPIKHKENTYETDETNRTNIAQ